ncbi:hypothetical protein HRbin39_00993 [bacterium HR39]|nr:hypothetical protein HRbin39_00993 [bacterium HR39]
MATDTAADSVGVTKPPVIPPTMASGISSTGSAARPDAADPRATPGTSPTGVVRGARSTTRAKRPNITRPGRIPATNMSATDTWATTAYTMKGIEGGMTGPSSPAAAVRAAANDRS